MEVLINRPKNYKPKYLPDKSYLEMTFEQYCEPYMNRFDKMYLIREQSKSFRGLSDLVDKLKDGLG